MTEHIKCAVGGNSVWHGHHIQWIHNAEKWSDGPVADAYNVRKYHYRCGEKVEKPRIIISLVTAVVIMQQLLKTREELQFKMFWQTVPSRARIFSEGSCIASLLHYYMFPVETVLGVLLLTGSITTEEVWPV